MSFLISEAAMKSLPKENKNLIVQSIENFIQECEKCKYNFQLISNGHSVRKVRGRENIFKFRVDQANRILFTFVQTLRPEFISSDEKNRILILDYCTHDNQIRRAKNLHLSKHYEEIRDEEIFEELIDKNFDVMNELFTDSQHLITRILNANELAAAIEDNEENTIYYLDKMQEECIICSKPLLLFGCAGSGKTTVTVNKLYQLYRQEKIQVGYFTYSKLLKEATEKYLISLINKLDEFVCMDILAKIDFYEVNEYFLNQCHQQDYFKFKQFEEWYQNSIGRQQKSNLNALDVWREIRGVLKGCDRASDKDFPPLNRNQKNAWFSQHQDEIERVYRDYERMLSNTNQVDENDIATQTFHLIKKRQVKQYDYLIIDEIQDLTEKQLKSLLSLVKDPNNLLLCGDANQSVYLNYFNPSHVTTLYYHHEIEFETKILTKNYRSSKDIVLLSNAVHQFRQSVVGVNKKFDYFEESVREHGVKPFILKNNEMNFERLVQHVIAKHDVIILVSGEKQKKQLMDIYQLTHNVFTVAEFKGIEKRYVICYNIVTDFEEVWEGMMNRQVDKGQNKYRQCLNLFYVAITRATQCLCFYEEAKDLSIYTKFEGLIHFIEQYDEKILMLDSESSSEDFLKAAIDYEKKGFYHDAKNLYRLSNCGDIVRHVRRCEAKELGEQGKYVMAGDIMLEIEEYAIAIDYFKKSERYDSLLKCMILNHQDYQKINGTLSSYQQTASELVLTFLKGHQIEKWVYDFFIMSEGYLEWKDREMNQALEMLDEKMNLLYKRLDNI